MHQIYTLKRISVPKSWSSSRRKKSVDSRRITIRREIPLCCGYNILRGTLHNYMFITGRSIWNEELLPKVWTCRETKLPDLLFPPPIRSLLIDCHRFLVSVVAEKYRYPVDGLQRLCIFTVHTITCSVTYTHSIANRGTNRNIEGPPSIRNFPFKLCTLTTRR